MKNSPNPMFALASLLMLLPAVAARAEIREAASMRDVAREINQDTLVIFDLDNTVMETAQMLGSDQWFGWSINQEVASGKTNQQAVEAVEKVWAAVQNHSNTRPVEGQTPLWISAMQTHGVQVMALTARPENMVPATLRQLSNIGVDFTRNPPIRSNFPVGNPALGQFFRGILFQNSNGSKGDTLLAFLSALHQMPKKIVFVDDRAENVKSVEGALARTSIPHIEFRYGAADSHVKMFNPGIAQIEMAEFQRSGTLLTDQQAAMRLPAPISR